MQNSIFSGLFIGQNLVTLKEVDSTNNFLKNILSNSKPVTEGTVIMAETQFAGRGQHENTWYAQSGKNLTFSLLLNPTFIPVQQQFDLVMAISVGVFDTLEPLVGTGLKIKWPNDIYYKDKKLGGMLIENILQSIQIKHSVIGIGINVNQENFPPDAGNATSLKQILQKDYDLKEILSQICSNIEAYYLQLKAGRTAFVRALYLSRLYWLNELRPYRVKGHTFIGSVTNVTDTGMLVVDNGQNEECFTLKEIEFLNK